MISQDTVDKIYSCALVEEVIGDFLQLKKSGSNYKGLSPFSNEQTPSFVVSPAKQIWKDFSSGKGGNVVSFLMEHEHFTYIEALKYLANKYNIEYKEEKIFSSEKKQIENEKESIYIIHEYAKNFFEDQLRNSEEGINIGLNYLKERGFKEEIIQKFQLGYARADSRHFTKKALKEGFLPKYLKKSGLSISKNEDLFDIFRGRIIFPIHSFSGRILGFGGRIINPTIYPLAKYINSPESNIYNKSQVIYGIHQAKQAILKQGICYLVEGYTDVISLYQSGVQNVVASSGTSLTVDQILMIKRLTSNIILLYDSDSAGIKAALRGIDMILEQNMNVEVILFPEGEDPDSFVHNHRFLDLLSFFKENRQNFIQFKTNFLIKKDKNDPTERALLIREIVESISKISNLIRREIYIKETARILKISDQVLFQELAQIDYKNRKVDKKQLEQKNVSTKIQIYQESNDIDPLKILEEELIRLMLFQGNHLITPIKDLQKERKIIQEIIEHFNIEHLEFSNAFYQKIFKEIQEGFSKGEYRTAGYFLQSNDEEIIRFVSSKYQDPDELACFDKKGIHVTSREKKLTHHFQQTLLRYKSHYISKLIQERQDNLKKENKNSNYIKKELCKLIDLKNQINKKLGREA